MASRLRSRSASLPWLVSGLALLACSRHQPLLEVDVTGDRLYDAVSLRLTTGPSLDKSFTRVTFGPAQTFRAGLFLGGVRGTATLLGEADDGRCVVARGSMMIPDVEKVVGAVALRLTAVPGCEPPRGDAGVDAAGTGGAGTGGAGGGGSGTGGIGTGGAGSGGTGSGGQGTGGSGTGGGGSGGGGSGGTGSGGRGSGGSGTGGGSGGTGIGGGGATGGGGGGGAGCLPPGNSGASPPDAGLTLVADTHYGFSATQGWCSWTYGYEAPPSTVFQPMTEWDPGYPAWWVKNGTYWTLVAPDVQHPNGTGTTGGRSPVEQWSVRRWTSTLAGDVVISGSARMAIAGGNGIDARIVVDGVVKYSRVVPGDDTVGIPFAVTASVVSGSTVDFIVDPHLSQDAVDTTYFAAQIWK